MREKAREELEKLGEPAVTSLLAALTSQNSNLRMQAAHALGNLHDTRAVEPLISALKASIKSNDFRFQMMATIVLGQIGDKRAIEPLRELAKVTPIVEVTKLANNTLNDLQGKSS
jgi:HEAT repeat protein